MCLTIINRDGLFDRLPVQTEWSRPFAPSQLSMWQYCTTSYLRTARRWDGRDVPAPACFEQCLSYYQPTITKATDRFLKLRLLIVSRSIQSVTVRPTLHVGDWLAGVLTPLQHHHNDDRR